MPECIFTKECAFYNDRLQEMPEMADFLKGVFCHLRPESCVRLRLSDFDQLINAANLSSPVLHGDGIQGVSR